MSDKFIYIFTMTSLKSECKQSLRGGGFALSAGVLLLFGDSKAHLQDAETGESI